MLEHGGINYEVENVLAKAPKNNAQDDPRVSTEFEDDLDLELSGRTAAILNAFDAEYSIDGD